MELTETRVDVDVEPVEDEGGLWLALNTRLVELAETRVDVEVEMTCLELEPMEVILELAQGAVMLDDETTLNSLEGMTGLVLRTPLVDTEPDEEDGHVDEDGRLKLVPAFDGIGYGASVGIAGADVKANGGAHW